jgi:hypothetical protein
MMETPDCRQIEIETSTLDERLSGTAVNLIKMDIQGWEPVAFGGMGQTLANNPGVRMVFEFWPEGIRLAGHNPRAFLEALHRLGFSLATFPRTGAPRPVSIDSLLARFVNRVHDHTNVLAERPSC